MPHQVANWSCSACSLAWVQRSTSINPLANEISAIAEIGYPASINPTYGLMDASGSALQNVLANYGVSTKQLWGTFDQIYVLAEQTTGMMSGGAWYHWVSIRGVQGYSIWIANSAPGYKEVYDLLSREQFNSLGPFSCVYLTP